MLCLKKKNFKKIRTKHIKNVIFNIAFQRLKTM